MTQVTRRAAATAMAGLAAAPLMAHAQGREPAPPAWLGDAVNRIQKALADFSAPGAGVAIVAEGRVVLAQGFGVRALGGQAPVNADTQFVIASCTKAFTAAGLSVLADAGALTLDQPLRELMADFQLMDPAAGAGAAARDLLCHRTGLPRHDMVWYDNNALSRADLVRRLRHLEPTAPFRVRHQYNNLMYITAGRLAEVVSGQSWEDFTRVQLLRPLGMNRTVFSVADMARDPNAAKPHERRRGVVEGVPYRNVDVLGPAGAINSTPRDIARWMLLHLNGGEIEGRRLLARDTLEQMHRPHIPIGQPSLSADISDTLIGLGWRTDQYRGRRRVHHGGALDGFRAMVQLFPDQRAGVAVFLNVAPSELPEMICRTVADRALSLEPRDWLGDALTRAKAGEEADTFARARKGELRRANAPLSQPLSAYAGAYEHPGYGRLTITQAGDKLSVGYNAFTIDLSHWHFDTFNGAANASRDDTFDDIRFQFETDLDGRIAAVSAPLEPTVKAIRFTRVPQAGWFDENVRARAVGDYQMAGRRWRVTRIANQLYLQPPGNPPAKLELDIEPGFFVLASNRFVRVRFTAAGMDLIQTDGIYQLSRMK
jgi:CubicO group peptidase (beta-lactamase class C family)